MNVVEPIRDPEDIRLIKEHLLEQGKYRDYCLFTVGINIGLRVSDLTRLRWQDVIVERDGKLLKFKPHVEVTEKKTGKKKKFLLNQSARDAIKLYYENIDPYMKREYMFNSRSNKDGFMSRHTVERMLKAEADYIGIDYPICTHSLRKTYGYHLRKKGVDLPTIMRLFNHSSPEITLRYIGCNQDDFDDANNLLNL